MTSASALVFAVVLTLLFAAYQWRHTEPDPEPVEYEEVAQWEESERWEEWEEWDDGEVVVDVEIVEEREEE